jgi:hypothetical protein
LAGGGCRSSGRVSRLTYEGVAKTKELVKKALTGVFTPNIIENQCNIIKY